MATRGTSAEQDPRFRLSSKTENLCRTLPFPPELNQQVDSSRLNWEKIHPWITASVTELLGFEDNVLIHYIFNLLEEKYLDGKTIQKQLTGFLEKDTGKFMKELWGMLTSSENCLENTPTPKKKTPNAKIDLRLAHEGLKKHKLVFERQLVDGLGIATKVTKLGGSEHEGLVCQEKVSQEFCFYF